MIEYQPLSPAEIQELRLKENRGELTPEDTKRFIESTRAKFLARGPSKVATSAAQKGPKGPPQESVDFF